MEMIFTMILVLVIITYWLINSMIVQLCLMILYVIMNSIMIFYVSEVNMISYLMLFSVVSGLVAVLAFVMLSEPNTESSMIKNSSMEVMYISLVLTITVFTYSEIINSSNNLLINQLASFSSFSMDLYLNMFLFMALIMLMMLFVVDLILMSYGGSMLPMK